MQNALMQHTTSQVSGLRAEVNEVKVMAKESAEQVREFRKELDEMKNQKAEEASTLRNLKHLEEEFQKLKATTGSATGAAVRQSRVTAGTQDQTDKRKRTVTFGNFPQDSKSIDIKAFLDTVMKDDLDKIEESTTQERYSVVSFNRLRQ